ncbi:MAG: amino acid permease [Cytophagaceae bacterium]|jgi:APA family basic amino acid/polyamine antiporter|nr:amino acid permease [Cytophagaceae bacterium]
MNQLFRTKSIQDILKAGEEKPLHKTLTTRSLIALGIGAIIGTGIFVLTGTAAANHAGPALVLSFILSALGCAFAGLCYAEFASMIPISGSAYTYAYATMGEFIAWIIGWDLILEYLFASSTVAVGWSGYMVSFLRDTLGMRIPEVIASAPLQYDIQTGSWSTTGSMINLPAFLIVLATTIILVKGIKESAFFNNVIVVVKLAVVLLVIGFGAFYVNTENWVPFIPENTGKSGQFGFSGILTGAGVIFFAYIGFDAVSTAAQETIDPKKSMPWGILGSLLLCTILYIAVSLVMTGIVHYSKLNVPAPIALAIDATGASLAWLSPLVKIGAIAGLSSVILVMLMGQPRIFMAMANDGLLPAVFARVHPTFKTPHYSTILTGLAAAVIASLFPVTFLGELVSIGTLLAFVIVCAGVIYLRKTKPDAPRPFRTPLVPWIPGLGILICGAQMMGLGVQNWMRLGIWLAIGLVIYFTYSIRHSKLRKA